MLFRFFPCRIASNDRRHTDMNMEEVAAFFQNNNPLESSLVSEGFQHVCIITTFLTCPKDATFARPALLIDSSVLFRVRLDTQLLVL